MPSDKAQEEHLAKHREMKMIDMQWTEMEFENHMFQLINGLMTLLRNYIL